MHAARRVMASTSPPVARRSARAFSASPARSVSVGDAVPAVQLMENSPGNKVSIAQELQDGGGKGLIIGVPAAFSPACSAKHIPGYIHSKALKDAGQVFVVSVNDAFVMKAWAESLDPEKESNIRFIADPHAEFTTALDLKFDGTAIFGQERSKRYALVVEDGKVKDAFVEPDNTGVDVSAAEKVLG